MARDAKYEHLQEPPLPYFYLPYAQEGSARMSLIVWTAGDPGAVAGPLREAVRAVHGDVPVETRTMRDLVDGYALMPARLISGIVGVMALAGLSLGVIGLYAVVAFVVSRRIREIGIRMALGGTRGAVLWSVLRSGLQVTVIGLAVGLGLAWLITPGFGANLPGVDHRDPMTFGCVALLVAGVALAASWIPARRAASVDPALTLRQG